MGIQIFSGMFTPDIPPGTFSPPTLCPYQLSITYYGLLAFVHAVPVSALTALYLHTLLFDCSTLRRSFFINALYGYSSRMYVCKLV